VTIQDVKFNTSATAAAGDSSWLDFPLSTPVTVDLATVTNGALAVFGSALKIPQGTYSQMQLLLTDTAAPLVASAQSAALLYNDQVQYLDSTGAAVTAPLDLVHPEQGIVLSVSLTVPNNTKAALESLDAAQATTTDANATDATTGLTTTGTTTTGLATTAVPTTPGATTCETTTTNTAATDTSTITPITTTTDNCSGVTTATFSVGIDFDAERDLVPFTYSGEPGFLLNPHLVAYDLSTAGTIQGQLTLPTTAATTSTTASGNPGIEVSAETLSSDGTRHVIVKSTPLLSDGSFVLYPLTTNATTSNTTTTTTYDLVVHGPNIQTMIIQSVPPSVAAPAAATSVALSTVTLISANDYLVNVSTAADFASPGALVQFYQTIPVSGEVPYVVAQQPIDPFNHDFAGDGGLSSGPINVTVYSGGVASTPVSEAPSEGTGSYQVAAIAPNFNDGALGKKVAPTASPTTAVVVSLAPLTVATGATSDSLTVATAVAAPGKYNNGELILSQNGAIVAVAPLGAVLDQSAGSVTFSRVPGGTSSQTLATGLYALSAWVWNSTNPSGTLHRVSSPTSVDLRSGTATGTSISID
jgi:hypothetical protein